MTDAIAPQPRGELADPTTTQHLHLISIFNLTVARPMYGPATTSADLSFSAETMWSSTVLPCPLIFSRFNFPRQSATVTVTAPRDMLPPSFHARGANLHILPRDEVDGLENERMRTLK